MKNELTVNEILESIDNDGFEYQPTNGIDEWVVFKVGENAYEIEVNFEDHEQVTISIFADELFESKLAKFVKLVNELLKGE